MWSDTHRQPFASISITVAGIDYAGRGNVVFAETSFTSVAAAQPGTATIVLRDPDKVLDFVEGAFVQCKIDGNNVWSGYAFTVDRGYWFGDYAVRKWTLHCVDLNILFDKLYIYNHAEPTQFPDNNGQWVFTVDGVTYRGYIPVGTTDAQLIQAYIADTDLNLMTPPINTTGRVAETTIIAPSQLPGLPAGVGGSLMQAGSVLRACMEDVSGNANPGLPGSYVFYIDPDGFLVYNKQDIDAAPFEVGEGGSGVSCRDLVITRDISTIKNDVILFTNELNPITKDTQFKYRHNSLTESINTYGRFQYSEVVSGFLASNLQVRSEKILFQEGTPAMRAEFTIYRPGLFPGQVVALTSDAFGFSQNLPIRSVEIRFPTPELAEFHVTCSFDTNDPYGLLLALKRPAARGFVPPVFQTVTITSGATVSALPPYTYVREIPKPAGTTASGSKLYQLSYGYIRYSIVVHAGGLRAISKSTQPNSSLDFNEFDPDLGQFTMSASSDASVYAEYHVSHDLPVA